MAYNSAVNADSEGGSRARRVKGSLHKAQPQWVSLLEPSV